ncbi:hypothetical protein AURDEDRAFT_164660 [Auricularia subglabra TFB-10046 SS5]|nr:hypothetical protein AURDEDRAFT_164660 [Auricularia subglabra TFB-10046 SS5]
MNLNFPEPEMRALGDWCLTKEQCHTLLKYHSVDRGKRRIVPQQELVRVYQHILGKAYNKIPFCFTAPSSAGSDLWKAHYVFRVTGDSSHSNDANKLAKLRKLLRDGIDEDISECAARVAALPLEVTEDDCETILGNISKALNVARKDVVFRLFQDPTQMENWQSDAVRSLAPLYKNS